MRKRHGRRVAVPTILLRVVLPVSACAALATVVPHPTVLWNQSASEPTGLYVRIPARPAMGRIIAFHAPAMAFPYADARMGYLHRVTILKEIAAGEGDVVCSRTGALTINGRWRAPVLERDPRGWRLPRWSGCRAMGKGEFFVFSDRIPNSFDSRYYGPVRTPGIVGVFQPLAIVSNERGAS